MLKKNILIDESYKYSISDYCYLTDDVCTLFDKHLEVPQGVLFKVDSIYVNVDTHINFSIFLDDVRIFYSEILHTVTIKHNFDIKEKQRFYCEVFSLDKKLRNMVRASLSGIRGDLTHHLN